MKLSIVDPSMTMDVVPKISEYANSQNKVNAADFFANHPFHVRMEEMSRRIFAPSPDGSFVSSKWFYERARGQYQDARANLTVSARRKFDAEFPKKLLIVKTDLAKYMNVWLGKPHVVSTGAQKNFANFAAAIGQEWDANADKFNDAYFREAIAKAIIFRETERLVSEQEWYEGGYRANVVAYGIAKLAALVSAKSDAVDFEAIWRSQAIPPAMRRALQLTTKAAFDVISNPPTGLSNVTEWA
jgi:hypothetical protein